MNTYSTEDIKTLSIEEITNLVNQIYDEKDLYKKKYESLLEAKKKHILSSQVADKVNNPVKSINSNYKFRSYDANDSLNDLLC